jgi:hypothetical protein
MQQVFKTATQKRLNYSLQDINKQNIADIAKFVNSA